MSTDRTTCALCGDVVVLPPGLVYRGEKYHKQCARARRERDLSVEQVGPQKEQDQADLEAWLENMNP